MTDNGDKAVILSFSATNESVVTVSGLTGDWENALFDRVERGFPQCEVVVTEKHFNIWVEGVTAKDLQHFIALVLQEEEWGFTVFSHPALPG